MISSIKEDFKNFKTKNNVFENVLSKVLFFNEFKEKYKEEEFSSIIGNVKIDFMNFKDGYNTYKAIDGNEQYTTLISTNGEDYLFLQSGNVIVSQKKTDSFFQINDKGFYFFDKSKETTIDNFYLIQGSGRTTYYLDKNENNENIYFDKYSYKNDNTVSVSYYFENDDKIKHIFKNKVAVKSNIISEVELEPETFKISSIKFTNYLMDLFKNFKDEEFLKNFKSDIYEKKHTEYETVYNTLLSYKEMASLLFDKELKIETFNLEVLKDLQSHLDKFNKKITENNIPFITLYQEEEYSNFKRIAMYTDKISYNKIETPIMLKDLSGKDLFDFCLKNFNSLETKYSPQKTINKRDLKNGI